MKLLKQGAEAKIFVSEYLGEKCVFKVREPKPYREKALDKKIIVERMRSEANLLSRAKGAGVRTPLIKKIDLRRREIVTEFISGKTLKEELQRGKGAGKLCAGLGAEIAKLHSADIVHGDLTTSNVVVRRGKLVFLDFGLGAVSHKIEDKAVDLLCLKKMFAATHFGIFEKWETVTAAYTRGFANGKAVLGRMKAVEARARYY